jgi:arginine deiminase
MARPRARSRARPSPIALLRVDRRHTARAAFWQYAPVPGVTSEVGPLRTVLVHRPGIELTRLTPQNKEQLLFDDTLWVERAQQEHDQLADLLRSRGAEVLYVRDLLEAVLVDDGVRGLVVDAVVTPATTGLRLCDHLRAALRECEMEALLDVLLGGVISAELPMWGIEQVFAEMAADRHQSVIRPLPNMMFMRDNAAWIGDGLMFGVLSWPVRRPESLIMSAIYRHHLRFTGADFPIWYGDREHDTYPATIEGGDVVVVDDRTVLIGSGERTAPAAVEAVARRLFSAGSADRVIVARFPQDRSFMHLDTVFTMVDVDKLNVFPNVLEQMRVYVVTPAGAGHVAVEERDGLIPTLEEVLDRKMEVITTGGDAVGQLREQWDDGNNTLALEPGVVIAYARNAETNRRLRDHGIEVLELDASELCRGRGGSRCLTQPIEREPVA